MHNINSQSKTPTPHILIHSEEEYRSIQLTQLVTTIYKKKYSVIAIVLAFTLMATGLAYFIKPQYQISTRILEPTVEQYKNLYSHFSSTITQAELFNMFLKKLNNKQNFNSFLKHAPIMQQEKLLPFKKKIKSRVNINQNKGLLRHNIISNYSQITDDGVDAELILYSPINPSDTKLNSAYLAFTNEALISELALKQRDINTLEIQKLERQISIQIDTLKNRLFFEEEKLKSAIANLNANKNSIEYKKQLSRLQKELYGTQYDLKLLTSEKKSTDTTLLTEKLRLKELKNLSFDLSNAQSYQIEGISTLVKNNPNRKLIITLGIFLGLIAALVIILLQMDTRTRQKLSIVH